jgi:hypothetical protein
MAKKKINGKKHPSKTKKHKKKISKAMKGRKLTQEHKDNIRKAKTGAHWVWNEESKKKATGKKRSWLARRAMAIAHLGLPAPNRKYTDEQLEQQKQERFAYLTRQAFLKKHGLI